MTEYLLQFGISNLCVASLLACAAWVVQRRGGHPLVAHLLWLLVLAKLVTPTLFTVPIVTLPGADAELPLLEAVHAVGAPTGAVLPAAMPAAESVGALAALEYGLLLTWLGGTVLVLVASMIRVRRFHRLLVSSSRPASDATQRLARDLGARLGLREVPEIQMSAARLAPMVWWVGGRVRVFIPSDLPGEMAASQFRWIVAHELAHVRRGDHYVRWLEWLVCVLFWWNPLAWWARRNLRTNEELCCDALVLTTFDPDPNSYASSLLTVAEFLSTPTVRPPALASRIDSGGFLERRFKMILSTDRPGAMPRWMRGLVLVFTLGVLPLGVAAAQNTDVDAVSKRLAAAVKAGELSQPEAEAMLAALAKAKLEEHLGRADRAVRQRVARLDQAGTGQSRADRARAERARAARPDPKAMTRIREGLEAMRKLTDGAEARKRLEEARKRLERSRATLERFGDRQEKRDAYQRVREDYRSLGGRIDRDAKRTRDAQRDRDTRREAESKRVREERRESRTRGSRETREDVREEAMERDKANKREIERRRSRDAAAEADERDRRAAESRRRVEAVRERARTSERRAAELEEVRRKLVEAVRAGRVSNEDMRRKIESIRRDIDNSEAETRERKERAEAERRDAEASKRRSGARGGSESSRTRRESLVR